MQTEFKKKLEIDGELVPAKLGCVHWRDAMVVIRSHGEFHQPPECISIGFVCNVRNVIYVVHNFSSGVPDDYICIPKDWVISVYYFRRPS